MPLHGTEINRRKLSNNDEKMLKRYSNGFLL